MLDALLLNRITQMKPIVPRIKTELNIIPLSTLVGGSFESRGSVPASISSN